MPEMSHEELVTAGGREARLKRIFDAREREARGEAQAAAEESVEAVEEYLETHDDLSGKKAPAYDPAGASVADVLAFVGDHPETAADVLASEQGGKNRKGIVEGLQRIVDGG